MNLSLTEFATLCRTAARGAGFSWGQAGDIGMACRWLAARGLWPAGAVDTLFAKGDACAFTAGMALADAGVCPASLRVAHPVALLPFVALMDQPHVVTYVDGDGPVDVQIALGTPEEYTLQTRALIAEGDVLALKALAMNTYAPATEESRRLGAG